MIPGHRDASPHDRVEPGPRSELPTSVADMVPHGVDADPEFIGNLLGALPPPGARPAARGP